jgi:hypothetical protein
MSLFKQFGTTKEETKISFPDAVNEDGTIPAFTLRRMAATNKRFMAAHTRYTKPVKNAIDRGALNTLEMQEINIKVFVEASLTGWEHVQDKGTELQFNTENARMLFERLPDLFFELQKEAFDIQNFQGEEDTADAKN